ncbi:hypothetical protein GTU99_08720 [Streptomyces sp. PRKS01-65]|nr:SAV_915 family protein [Streptomyces harenosi]NEY32271.1 hypothetical protein [Streptomyces harenosi]
MTDVRHDEDPAPADQAPAGPLYVPVRPARCCYVTCFFRTPSGRRTAVAFTTPAQLLAALGRDQHWIRLSAAALRSLSSPLGCTALTIDPQSSVPADGADPPPPGRR